MVYGFYMIIRKTRDFSVGLPAQQPTGDWPIRARALIWLLYKLTYNICLPLITNAQINKVWLYVTLARFSFQCRKLIAFASTTLNDSTTEVKAPRNLSQGLPLSGGRKLGVNSAMTTEAYRCTWSSPRYPRVEWQRRLPILQLHLTFLVTFAHNHQNTGP